MRILRLERTPVAQSCTFSQPSPKCFHLHPTKIFSKFCTSLRPFMGVCLSCCFSYDDMFSWIHQLINPPLSHGKTRLGLNRWRASRAKPTLITALVSPQVPPLHTNMCHLLISFVWLSLSSKSIIYTLAFLILNVYAHLLRAVLLVLNSEHELWPCDFHRKLMFLSIENST